MALIYKARLYNIIYLVRTLVISPKAVEAVACGKWYSSPCLASSDVRYKKSSDDTGVDDLFTQNEVWKKVQGYFVTESYTFIPDYASGDLEPARPTHFNPELSGVLAAAGFPYGRYPSMIFINNTIVGSRFYTHRYFLNPPAPKEFCNSTIPEGKLPYILEGVCGETGYSYAGEAFGTASFERDGSVITMKQITIHTYIDTSLLGFEDDGQWRVILPVDNNTVYGSAIDNTTGQDFYVGETLEFLDDNVAFASTEAYVTIPGIGRVRALSRYDTLRQLDESEWQQKLLDTYEEFKIPKSVRVQKGQVPMLTPCLAQFCPLELDWCRMDPRCAESPYQEPDGVINTSAITAIVVPVTVLLLTGLYCWYRKLLFINKENIKTKLGDRATDVARCIRQVEKENKLSYERYNDDPGFYSNGSQSM